MWTNTHGSAGNFCISDHISFSSDGVTSIRKSLFQIIQEIVAKRDIGVHLDDAKSLYPHCTPKTREALYYR